MFSVARSRVLLFVLLASAVLIALPSHFGGVATAGTVDIYSNLVNETNNKTGTDVSLSPDKMSPAWAPTGPGYEWISYGDTGCNEYVVLTGTCIPGPANPPAAQGTINGPNPVAATAIFYKTFTVTDALDSGYLNVWADDTARVWLDPGTITTGDGSGIDGGTMLIDANPILGTNCAGGPIGCLPGMDATFNLSLTTGTYTLVIDAYQLVTSSPFGVMYDGVLTDVPEPATFALMGLGLIGMGVFVRRRNRA